MTTNMISSQLELLRLNTGREVRVATANTLLKRMLFRYQGHVSAALVLGGVDISGPHIYSIHPHGSTDRLPYTTMGSGSLAAMAVFEGNFSKNVQFLYILNLIIEFEILFDSPLATRYGRRRSQKIGSRCNRCGCIQ